MSVLEAPYTLEYTYRRSTGPVIGGFLTGLRDKEIRGVLGVDGRVIVPSVEYDPKTGASLDELVPLSDKGVVTTWTWVEKPRPEHPLDKPFAFALIRVYGADTCLLHAVDVGSPEEMRTGMRVQAAWREDRVGYITDIRCFLPIKEEREDLGDAS